MENIPPCPKYGGLFSIYACTQGKKWGISFRVEFCILLWLTDNSMENKRKFRPNNDLEYEFRARVKSRMTPGHSR